MIHPNIRIIQEPVAQTTSVNITNIPEIINKSNVDPGYIDFIRNQPLFRDIEKYTEVSELKDDFKQLVQLLGSYCKINSIDQIKQVVKQIHDSLNNKKPYLIKDWTRLLLNLHPKIDQTLKTLPFFQSYGEVIGTDTILYYADSSSIDIVYWAKQPAFLTNEIVWTTTPQNALSFIRETTREKISSAVVKYIQNAGQVVSSLMSKNIIYEYNTTTEDGTGNEVVQTRPVDPSIAHGVALKNDTNFVQLISDLKETEKKSIIDKLDQGGYLVHLLINHLNPLNEEKVINHKVISTKAPLGIEESFPNTDPTRTTNIGNNSQKILNSSKNVNDTVINSKVSNE